MRSISTQSILVWLSIPQNCFSQHLFFIFNYLNIRLRFSLVQSSIVIILLTLVLFLFIWYTVGTSQISFYQCAGCVCVCVFSWDKWREAGQNYFQFITLSTPTHIYCTSHSSHPFHYDGNRIWRVTLLLLSEPALWYPTRAHHADWHTTFWFRISSLGLLFKTLFFLKGPFFFICSCAGLTLFLTKCTNSDNYSKPETVR